MAREIDYDSVEIPPDKSTEDYHYSERRKDLLERIREKGTPRRLPPQSRLAEQYGLNSQSVISDDLDVLAEYIEETLADRHVLSTSAALDRALSGALDAEKWEAASRIAERRTEWVRSRTVLRELNQKLDRLDSDLADRADRRGRDGESTPYPEVVLTSEDDDREGIELRVPEDGARQ